MSKHRRSLSHTDLVCRENSTPLDLLANDGFKDASDALGGSIGIVIGVLAYYPHVRVEYLSAHRDGVHSLTTNSFR